MLDEAERRPGDLEKLADVFVCGLDESRLLDASQAPQPVSGLGERNAHQMAARLGESTASRALRYEK